MKEDQNRYFFTDKVNFKIEFFLLTYKNALERATNSTKEAKERAIFTNYV